uniref:Uncharacterized protein n=1 Tax=Rousettus aegyptiacus TaxID=9407 RepID=A0A7J8BE84_ROUAE|nr:hypothetical protein HJG63_009795 [Rousettus aegyptiacus]
MLSDPGSEEPLQLSRAPAGHVASLNRGACCLQALPRRTLQVLVWGFLSIVRSELIGTRSGETGRRRGFVSGWSCARVPAGWRGSPQVCADAAGGAAYGGAPWARGMSLARLGLPSAGFTIWHQLAPRRCPAANQTPVLPLPWRSAAILSSSHYLGSGFSHGVPGGWEKGPWGFVSSSRYPSSESPHRYAIFKNTASGGLVSVRLCAKYSPCHLRWLRSQ